jgi:hypothetical protein
MVSFAHDEVTFPVTGYDAILDFFRSLLNTDKIRYATTWLTFTGQWASTALVFVLTKRSLQFFFETTTS